MQKTRDLHDYTVPILTTVLLLTLGVLIFVLFAKNPSGLTIEILAAIIAVVLVVASVCITVHYQHLSDMKREFNVQLFEQKLTLYRSFIEMVVTIDDDNEVTQSEIMSILNKARLVALVGKASLVETITNFLDEVISHQSLIVDSDKPDRQFSTIVQLMRDDLAVVDDSDSGSQTPIRDLMLLAPRIHGMEKGS